MDAESCEKSTSRNRLIFKRPVFGENRVSESSISLLKYLLKKKSEKRFSTHKNHSFYSRWIFEYLLILYIYTYMYAYILFAIKCGVISFPVNSAINTPRYSRCASTRSGSGIPLTDVCAVWPKSWRIGRVSNFSSALDFIAKRYLDLFHGRIGRFSRVGLFAVAL